MTLLDLPTPDVRVDWRGDGHNFVLNDLLEVNTNGWSVAAGINAAATSLTAVSAWKYYGMDITGLGTAGGAELVTTAVSGSGCKYVITGTFVAGRTYRFRLYLISISGTQFAKITVGSLGTPVDRASSSFQLTTSWVEYQVDWTPSANRSDVQIAIMNNAAAIMTSRFAVVDVYEAIDDISDDMDYLTVKNGASFDGSSAAPGTASVRVDNGTQKYSRDNASSPLTGLVKINRSIFARAIDITNASVYPLFGGTIRRIVPDPAALRAELMCEDALFTLGRAEVSVAASVTRSLADFRTAVLTAAGIAATNINLTIDGSETEIPYTGCDQRDALGVLSDVNVATGCIHYVAAHPSSAVGWRYETRGRLYLQGLTPGSTWNDILAGISGYDHTDEAVVNQQRVTARARQVATAAVTVWTSEEVPFTVGAGLSRTVWASFSDPVFNQAVASTATNAPTITITPFGDSAKIVITAGGTATTVSALSVTGKPAAEVAPISTLTEDAASQAADQYGVRAGTSIDSKFLASAAHAAGIGGFIVYRYKAARARPTLRFENYVSGGSWGALRAALGRSATLTFPRLSLAAQDVEIRDYTHTVDMGARMWATEIGVEEVPPPLSLFQLGPSVLDGASVLGY